MLKKCYNITRTGSEAELSMYGEVVQTRPVDFWTGEPITGDFIAQDEIIRDLEALKEIDHLTVRINSVGGDYYAGLAIRNRLRSLGIKVDTINDSLAASAGSIILQGASGGGKRKVYAASATMVHGVSGFMYGYYNAGQLTQALNQLGTGDKLAAKCYAESGTVSEEDAAAAMAAETWMSGEEAVEKGFADEVISSESEAVLTMDNHYRMQAGSQRLVAGWLSNMALPSNIKKVDSLIDRKETEEMEIKNLNDLKAAYPDLVREAEETAGEAARNAVEIPDVDAAVSAAVENALKEERERMQEIDALSGAVADPALIADAKYIHPVSAEKFALAAMKATAEANRQALKNLEEDGKSSGTGTVTPAPQADTEKDDVLNAMINKAKALSGQK